MNWQEFLQGKSDDLEKKGKGLKYALIVLPFFQVIIIAVLFVLAGSTAVSVGKALYDLAGVADGVLGFLGLGGSEDQVPKELEELIEKEVGENANIGERIISILGENKLEIVLQVSELDVSKLVPGSSIKISLDAIPGEEFSGILKTVNSKETEIDGVPVYEAFVELESDPRIKNGMNADGIIILANKENILAIPSYLIKKVGNLNFVNVVLDDGSITKRELILGLMGTNSMVEIISGLNAGEKVVTNANEK